MNEKVEEGDVGFDENIVMDEISIGRKYKMSSETTQYPMEILSSNQASRISYYGTQYRKIE